MDENRNKVYEHARKVSEYFVMALNVGIGSGAAVGLWQFAAHHPETALVSRIFAVAIGLSSLYLASVFVLAVWVDLSGMRRGRMSTATMAAQVVGALVALTVLVSLIYFARTTAMEMMG